MRRRLWVFTGSGVRFVSGHVVQLIYERFHTDAFGDQMSETVLRKRNMVNHRPFKISANPLKATDFFEVFHGVRIERETYAHNERTQATDDFFDLFVLETISLYK